MRIDDRTHILSFCLSDRGDPIWFIKRCQPGRARQERRSTHRQLHGYSLDESEGQNGAVRPQRSEVRLVLALLVEV